MIKVNDNARDQVQKLLAEDGCPEGSFVRVGVKGGGCSGLMYQLDFDHLMNDDDLATWFNLARDGNVLSIISGPPCETYSGARFTPMPDKHHGPRPLRNKQHQRTQEHV